MLDFRIQTFLCVCRHMNFSSAAEALHITQPAVSQHIHYLEKMYGMELFVRKGKHIFLTTAGEILRDTMLTMQNDTQVMERRMKQSLDAHKQLSFGVTMTIGEYVITTPLAHYLKRYPDTNVHIRYDNTARLLQALRDGQIEFALVEGDFRSEQFDTLVYRTERFLPVCAAGHVFAQPVRQLKDLLPERLLVREQGSGGRVILEKNLAVKNLSIGDFAHEVQVENVHTIVSLLEQDCGIAFLYESAVRQAVAQGKVRVLLLEDFCMQHDFTFLWNKGSVFSGDYYQICMQLKNLDVSCAAQGQPLI